MKKKINYSRVYCETCNDYHYKYWLDGKQFTCIELSFIRFCMDRIIWSMIPNEIYHDGEIVHVRERAKHILKVTNELLKEIDEQFKEYN